MAYEAAYTLKQATFSAQRLAASEVVAYGWDGAKVIELDSAQRLAASEVVAF